MTTIKTSLGDTDYVVGVFRDEDGSNIQGRVFQVCLGTPTAPGATWYSPASVVQGSDVSEVHVSLLVGPGGVTNPPLAVYSLWVRVIDSPVVVSVVAVDAVTLE